MATKKELAPGEVCAIIKACGEFGVASLQWGDLAIHMESKKVSLATPETPHPVPEAVISELQKQQAEREMIQAELATKDVELEEMLISDPVRFEELLLKGDLDDDDGSRADEEA